MSQLIALDELKTVTGHKTLSAVERCLQKQGIKVIYGKKGFLFTTVDAINCVLGISKVSEQTESIEFDE